MIIAKFQFKYFVINFQYWFIAHIINSNLFQAFLFPKIIINCIFDFILFLIFLLHFLNFHVLLDFFRQLQKISNCNFLINHSNFKSIYLVFEFNDFNFNHKYQLLCYLLFLIIIVDFIFTLVHQLIIFTINEYPIFIFPIRF